MADKKKFERMLELLIAEDRKGAEELFHEIVVEQSRTIYESILEDDLKDEEVDEASDEDEDDDDVSEASDDDVDEATDDDLDEGFDLDEFEVEADPTDDMMGDVAFDNDEDEMGGDEDEMGFGGDEGDEDESTEDRITDLEDALDDLKAEFDRMMSGDDEGDEDEMGFGDDEGDEDDDEDETEEDFGFGMHESEDEEVDESDEDDDVKESDKVKKTDTETMREYVEKVGKGGGLDHNGELKSEAPGANTKSTVASKNDMGGTASNIVRNDTEAGVEANKGSIKGAALNVQNKKEDSHGNVNVPGGKAAKSLKPNPKGHGTEKKGAAETAPDKKSLIGSKK